MFNKLIKKWKLRRDDKRDNEIKQHLRAYWFKFRRHDLLVNVMLETDFSTDDLVELSNLFGQVAHDRERKLTQ
jgi:hypothetical protein